MKEQTLVSQIEQELVQIQELIAQVETKGMRLYLTSGSILKLVREKRNVNAIARSCPPSCPNGRSTFAGFLMDDLGSKHADRFATRDRMWW